MRKCVEERAQKLLQPSPFYNLNVSDNELPNFKYPEWIAPDIEHMDSFIGGRARFFCSNATMNKIKKHKEDLEGFKQRVDNSIIQTKVAHLQVHGT